MERELAATRMGAGTPDGAVAQVETTGFVAATYDHWDSRAGDPHLHTHVVFSNKVLTARDRKWRSVDSHAMYAWVVSVSEFHQAVLADQLTRALGVDWEARSRGRDRNPDWAIASVPQSLTRLYSQRSADIDEAADEVIESRSSSTATVLAAACLTRSATAPASLPDRPSTSTPQPTSQQAVAPGRGRTAAATRQVGRAMSPTTRPPTPSRRRRARGGR